MIRDKTSVRYQNNEQKFSFKQFDFLPRYRQFWMIFSESILNVNQKYLKNPQPKTFLPLEIYNA